MPDPSNPIFFPELNDVDGSTCGDFSFGWTSGCTDDLGIDRGFTQDWYYDGSVGAGFLLLKLTNMKMLQY